MLQMVLVLQVLQVLQMVLVLQVLQMVLDTKCYKWCWCYRC